MTLDTALAIDVPIVVGCTVLLAARGDLRHSHPAVIYLVFHALTFTLRGFGLAHGAEPYLGSGPQVDPLQDSEVAYALNLADAFLVACTLGWVTAAKATPLRQGKSPRDREADGIRIPDRYVVWATILCVPLGVITLLQFAYIPGINSGTTVAASSYLTLAQTWPALTLSALIYKWGFKWYLTTGMAFYFVLIAAQGQGRYRLVLPAILLLMIYLDRRKLRWPSIKIVAILCALFLLFFPLKMVGKSIQSGASFDEISNSVASSLADVVTGKDQGEMVLDQYAMVVSASDNLKHRLHGKPFLALLTLPVPRPMWPDKPTLNGAIKTLSTPGRPLDITGAVTTMPGAFYANFGLLGLLLGAFLMARLLARAYRYAYRCGQGTIQHLIYLVLAASLVQVFRDDPMSFVVFVFVYNLPLFVIWWLLKHRRRDAVWQADRAGEAWVARR